MSFIGTSITDVPECFKCFWSDVSGILPPTVPIPTLPYPCNTTIEQTFYVLTPSRPYFIIRGENLGFGASADYSPELYPIAANSIFEFLPTDSRSSGEATATFSISRGISKQVSWVYDLTVPTPNKAFIERKFGNWRLSAPGIYNSSFNYEMLANDNKWYPCNSTNTTLLLCDVSTSIFNYTDNLNVTIRNQYQEFKLLDVKIYLYPSISSFTRTIDTSKNISFFGYFGHYSDNTSVTTKVNGHSCNITFADSTVINCTIMSNGTTTLTIGYANLTIIINGQSFISNKTLAIFPSQEVDDCGVGCNGHGQCINHKCQCNKGFSGYYCESELKPDVTILPDPTQPAATITANATTFSINIVSIQELDQDGNIVYEQLVKGWTHDSIKDNNVKTDRYNLTNAIDSDLTTSVTLAVSSQDRVVPFAGQNVTYTANSLKMTMTINHWNFHSNLNTLRVVIHKNGSMINDTSSPCGTKNVVSVDAYQNLQYLKVISNGIEIYGRFLPVILADGRPSLTRNEIINTTTDSTFFGINMFQCRQQCIIDPDFSVLVDANPVPKSLCEHASPPSDRWKLPVIVVTVSVGAIVIIAVVTKIVINKLHGRYLTDVIQHKMKSMTGKNKDAHIIRM
ncbi:hypothetical protein SAMD00019534_055670 [Acytostelium subglobosum LB1]|uniref:hypothetical protein n=1 Tax=Acytostelium subglobosum LB1 TaxID=1410327 RepID=UPI000644C8AB|nr:hypothetical protein SAMD00019534_055670 [Acytostelium subglobosum LB1]GAM22392.1 hypothetical protein SAMD00019534_055670 [Acytostelium subglobosum LB1]|eukprot:XP_012754512.1 hypothetical protein SAMD00019534_055670 [Acytostelium subglobosum LB1]